MATRRINDQYSRAYKAAGFAVQASRPGHRPPRPLRPETRPPGFSKLPEPAVHRDAKRSKPAPTVPHQRRQRRGDPRAAPPALRVRRLWHGYVRTAAGTVLASYRDSESPRPARSADDAARTLTKTQWATLLAVAEPGPEREHFLRDAALKRITIED